MCRRSSPWALRGAQGRSICAVTLVACGPALHTSLSPSSIRSRWGAAGSGDREIGSTSRCHGQRYWPYCGLSRTPPCSNSMWARGAARGRAPPPSPRGPSPPPHPPPPGPADIMGDRLEAPTTSTHFRTAMGAVQAQGASTGFEVCLLACLRAPGLHAPTFGVPAPGAHGYAVTPNRAPHKAPEHLVEGRVGVGGARK